MNTYRHNSNLVILCLLRCEGQQKSDTNNEMTIQSTNCPKYSLNNLSNSGQMECFRPLPTTSKVTKNYLHSTQLILQASIVIEHISNPHALYTDRVYINIYAKIMHILRTHFEIK
jgi:hypothetical protein